MASILRHFLKGKREQAVPQDTTKFNEASEEVEDEWTVIDACDKKSSKDDFELVGTLGKGAFGRVLLVKEKATGTMYAMKMIEKKNVLKHGRVKDLFSERSVLRKSHHPFIMHLHRAFQSETKLYFVMDYLKAGDFDHYLNSIPKKRLDEDLAKIYAAEVFLALEYLHEHHIIYRDLKPENILLEDSGHVCLSDFGLSKDFENEDVDRRCNSFVGSPFYVAPDVLRQKEYGSAVDWWGFGILVFRMLTGTVPFTGNTMRQVFDCIMKNSPDLSPFHFVSDEAKDMILKLLDKNEQTRLDGAGVRSHPWMADVPWDQVQAKTIDMRFAYKSSAPGAVPQNISQSPADAPVIGTQQQQLFEGFTYDQSGGAGSLAAVAAANNDSGEIM